MLSILLPPISSNNNLDVIPNSNNLLNKDELKIGFSSRKCETFGDLWTEIRLISIKILQLDPVLQYKRLNVGQDRCEQIWKKKPNSSTYLMKRASFGLKSWSLLFFLKLNSRRVDLLSWDRVPEDKVLWCKYKTNLMDWNNKHRIYRTTKLF